MNEQQAENLRVLIRHMETNVTRELYMGQTDFCGTPACALGEATRIEALGLKLCEGGDGVFVLVNGVKTFYSTAAKDVFGTVHPFGATIPLRGEHTSRVTPQEWAAEARKVLAENGYTMDSPADPFKRFMDKAMEPVSLEATVTLR